MSKKTWTAPTVEELGIEATLGGPLSDVSEAALFVSGPSKGLPVGTAF